MSAILVLEGHGAQVYVDEVDPEMAPYTNTETAAILKSRIRQSKKLVLLTSKNSKESRWVPWELGVADGYKDLGNIAVSFLGRTLQHVMGRLGVPRSLSPHRMGNASELSESDMDGFESAHQYRHRAFRMAHAVNQAR